LTDIAIRFNKEIMKGFILITKEELEELLRVVVKEELASQSISTPSPLLDQKPFYSREETAGILQVTLPTLNKYVKNGSIICHRIGNRVLFKARDIDEAIVKRNFK
jgi:excisionase family DNA binding protein